ncbi:MAG: SDR family oxidoreductase [Actinobacteria bacterium]|nr:SDR family oxidoreductase [Actinomycetota bacterium]
MLLGALLVDRGDAVRGLIRNPDQEADLRERRIEPLLCDLEGDDDVAAAVRGADAVVFAAGAGPGSGEARKSTMDLGGAVKLIEAARSEGISRYLMVSAMGAAAPPAAGTEPEGADSAAGDDVFGAYLRAKASADEALRTSGLDFTIVRPGGLTDDRGTGLVSIAERLDRGQVPRADVAAVLLACLEKASTIGQSFDLTSGDTPIAAALPR